MNWTNVRLILQREVRDQLRDRRTLFTIVVLPLLLYPLIGMSFFQIAQFMREHPTRVWILGASHLPADPPLFDGERFREALCPESEAKLLLLSRPDELPAALGSETPRQVAEREIQSGRYDAVVFFPPEFATGLGRTAVGEESRDSGDGEKQNSGDVAVKAKLEPQIFFNMASDKSRIAYERVDRVLRRWREKIVQDNLARSHIPIETMQPFQVVNTDVAEETMRRAAVWSKVLPFVVLIWALTGAFYPAIDLCAGEKERGTLETLLSSPAERGEIVWGKLLTIMSFSTATSVLNLLSMGVTGAFIVGQMQQMDGGLQLDLGPPPLASLGWLLLGLVPISALFSALSLAVAAFARSSKEGQYYLMPLLLITLPLMMLPMLPTAQLDLGTSLIPVAGMMLLLRSLIEGHYWEALRFVVPVCGVTAIGCLLSLRWAVDQFNNESVLFRESERWGLGVWVRCLLRDRGATPTFSQAFLCGILLLMIQFFATLQVGQVVKHDWAGIRWIVLVTQVAFIATPVLLMTIILTRSPRRTLLLTLPRPLAIPAACLLAVSLHPVAMQLSKLIQWLYPLNEETLASLQPFQTVLGEAPVWQVLFFVACLPAVCEELAFRGFILSGLRHMGHRWLAILLSSAFFGITHGILQQSLAACIVGVVIGYLAVQTGSLLPGVIYHLTHNGLAVVVSRLTPEWLDAHPQFAPLFTSISSEGPVYQPALVVLGGLLALLLLLWFRALPFQPYAEERLQTALNHQSAVPGREVRVSG